MKKISNHNKKHVTSGEYFISTKKNMFFEAYLGTCVGITLCDQKSGVAGLIHLLLPKPPNPLNPWKPEVYASTGLPLFTKAMYNKGADKNNLKACVAGGALMGPVSRQDLNLDIGGRTTEIALNILRDEGIPVVQTETGGYFGCSLTLDLNKFESLIEPLLSSSSPSANLVPQEKPSTSYFNQKINLIKPIPQIALKVTRMVNSGSYEINKVAAEIKQDQVLSAKMITFCNSSFIGLKNRIDSIDRALVLMGKNILLPMLMASCQELFLTDSGHGYSLCKGGLFKHSVGTATVSEELARLTGKVSPIIAYTAGLLHDIGKIVLDQFNAATDPLFYRQIVIDNIELHDIEKEKFGFTHPQAGEILAENWGLPDRLADVIKHHHQPEKARIDPELTHLVYLADVLNNRFQAGQVIESLSMEKLPQSLKILNISVSQLSKAIESIFQKLVTFM